MKNRKPGKRIGGAIYVHRDYVTDAGIPMDAYEMAQTWLPSYAKDYIIVKYVLATGDFSFIQSPDFDTASEPVVGLAVKISPNGNIHITKQKDDPQIYHHKWEMVGDDYDGFDVAASREWSRHWRSVIGVNKDISNRIVCPNITYLQYKEIAPLIQRGDNKIDEYYGNYTIKEYKVVWLRDLYDALRKKDLIESKFIG